MSNNNSIRLLIAVEGKRLREALAIYFSIHEDVEIVGQTADAYQTQLLCRQLKPDVLLLDPELQENNQIALITSLHQENILTKIIILATPVDEVTAEQTLQAGAARYIEKGILASDLMSIIRKVYHPV